MKALHDVALFLGWIWLAMMAGLLVWVIFELVRGMLQHGHAPPSISERHARLALAPHGNVVPLTTHAPSLATADGAREDSTFDERQNTD